MICAIMQPTFMPWLGYFDMIDKVDRFVFLQDVQLAKRSWQVRNRIKTNQGELFLTIPIKKVKSRDDQLLLDAEINNEEKWRIQHIKSIQNAYSKASHYKDVFPFIESYYNNKYEKLSGFTIDLISGIVAKIGIQTPLLLSSEMNIAGAKDEKLAGICNYLGCQEYLSPQGSSEYIESNRPGGEIVGSKIDLFYFDYTHPVYEQQYPPFLPYCGIFDMLFNIGFDEALNMIRSGRKDNIHFRNFPGSHSVID
jgi:hypothetical protein